MEFKSSAECAKYFPAVIEDPRVNWATPLEVIASAAKESINREFSYFKFIADIRGINGYFYEIFMEDCKKSPGSRMFSDRMNFSSSGKDYSYSWDVSFSLNSEFVRRIENSGHRPYYYALNTIQTRLDKLTFNVRELLVPAGIGFFERFACDKNGNRFYDIVDGKCVLKTNYGLPVVKS